MAPRKHTCVDKIISESVILSSGPPIIYQPKFKQISSPSSPFKILELGQPVPNVPHRSKTVLIIGESGSGKSTIINGLFHYILGVKWSDGFRFDIIRGETKKDRSKSLTQEIIAYTIHHEEGYNIPYSVTLIDTPGFQNTSNGLTDHNIFEQLQIFLQNSKDSGIDCIDAIGLAVQSSQCNRKLLHNMYKYLKSIFGENVIKKIFFLLTFADARKPLVLERIKKSGFPEISSQHFIFNNSALFEYECGCDTDFERFFWEKNLRGCQALLSTLKPISLYEESLKRCQEEGLTEFIEQTRNQLGSCPITMKKNWRRYIATASHGEARALQAPNSDVSLKIPKGSRGVFISRVHTDYTRVRDTVPESECIVGPFVEFGHLGKRVNEDKLPQGWYEIKIPHCVEDKALWTDIKVRKGSIFSKKKFIEVPRSNGSSNDSTYYDVNEKFITIFTKHFCHFTCSICNYSCEASALIFLFGNLNISRDYEDTHVNLKVFLCSNLFSLKDFTTDLTSRQQQQGYRLIRDKRISLDSQNKDPKKCEITLSIAAETSTPKKPLPLWKPADPNTTSSLWDEGLQKFTMTDAMSKVMDLDGCHNCRSPNPMDAMSVDMTADQMVNEFRGKFKAHADLKTITAPAGLTQNPQQAGNVTKVPIGQTDFTFRVTNEGSNVQDSQTYQNRQSFENYPETNNNTLETCELLDDHILELSRTLTQAEMHRLKVKLKIKNPGKEEALEEWLKNQPDRWTAHLILKEALKNAELTLYIVEILGKKY